MPQLLTFLPTHYIRLPGWLLYELPSYKSLGAGTRTRAKPEAYLTLDMLLRARYSMPRRYPGTPLGG